MDPTWLSRLRDLLKLDESVDAGTPVISFDRESDELVVHFFGRNVPAVSMSVRDDYLVRFDREHDRVVGVQLDHFLSVVAREHPELLILLDLAELRGTTLEELAEIRKAIARERLGSLVTKAYEGAAITANAAD